MGNTVHSLQPDLSLALDGRTVGSVVHGLSDPGPDDRDETGVSIEPPESLLLPEPERSSLRAGEVLSDDALAHLDGVSARLEELVHDRPRPLRPDVAAVEAFLVQTDREAWA